MVAKKETVIKICEVCGKEFGVKPYRKNTARFCGRLCQNKCLSKNNIGSKRTPESCAKISSKLKGRIITEGWRRKNSESHIGQTPWNKGKRGIQKGPNKGKTFSPEWRAKLSAYRKGVYTLEKHPRWMGGISYEPYCPKFNEEFKNRVRSFFGNRCVICGEEITEYKSCVHHVNYDKYVCCNGNLPMFVSLCRSCHGKTNSKREYWANLFNEIIHIQYGGKCYFTIDEYYCDSCQEIV